MMMRMKKTQPWGSGGRTPPWAEHVLEEVGVKDQHQEKLQEEVSIDEGTDENELEEDAR